MPNVFVDLPLPALNGPGAAVDVSTMGGSKTIAVAGSFPGATITIEASVDGGAVYGPVVAFQNGEMEKTVAVAAQFMRVSVSGRKNAVPFSASIGVGANDAGAQIAALPMPVLNGPGAAVDVSALPDYYTFICGGDMAGAAVLVELSEDGSDWAPVVQFSGQGGLQSKSVTAQFMRANVSGRKSTVPFTATLAVGATTVSDSGGGGGTGVIYDFVFQPGGVDDANVYSTFAALMAAVGAVTGRRRIFYDNSIAPLIIPAGAWNFTNVLHCAPFGQTLVEVQEGAVFTGFRQSDQGIVFNFTGATPPVSDLSSGGIIVFTNGGGMVCTGTGPFIDVTTPNSFCVFVFDLGSVLVGAESTAGAIPVIRLSGAGCGGLFIAGERANIQANTIEGIVGTTLIANVVSSSGFINETQPGFLGTLAVQNGTEARLDPTDVKTGDYTATINEIVAADPSGAPFTVTLPLAFNNRGKTVVVKNVTGSANAITVAGNGADTIDSLATASISTSFGFIALISDGGANWDVVASPGGAGGGMAIGAAITGATDGSVLFVGLAGVLAQDNAALFWDDAAATLKLLSATNPLYVLLSDVSGTTSNVVLDVAAGADAGSVLEYRDDGTFVGSLVGFDKAPANGLTRGVTLSSPTGYKVGFRVGDPVPADLRGWFGATGLNIGSGDVEPGVRLNIETEETTAAIQLGGGSSVPVGAADSIRLAYTTTSKTWFASLNGDAYRPMAIFEAAAVAGSVPFVNADGRLAQDNANFFWDDTNNRLGIGTLAPGMAIDVATAEASANAAAIRASQASSYADILFFGTGDVLRGGVGYGNAAVGTAHLQAVNFLYSTGTAAAADWVVANDTANNFRFHMQDANVALSMADGVSAAVGASGTLKYRYNNTTKTLQVSLNGGAYQNVVTSPTIPQEQRFTFTAAGGEGPGAVTVTLPAARPDAAYVVLGGLVDVALAFVPTFPSGGRTTTQFTFVPGIILTAGDSVDFYVAQKT